jgi:hypothetical protein
MTLQDGDDTELTAHVERCDESQRNGQMHTS